MADRHFDARLYQTLLEDPIVRGELGDCLAPPTELADCSCEGEKQRILLNAYAAARDCLMRQPPERQLRLLQLTGWRRLTLTAVAADGRIRRQTLDRDALLAALATQNAAPAAS